MSHFKSILFINAGKHKNVRYPWEKDWNSNFLPGNFSKIDVHISLNYKAEKWRMDVDLDEDSDKWSSKLLQNILI